ncbi:MAG: hypothetical protein GXO21_00075 [Aquificae bacterium]|nr:hypothetical protein [Aquificota bacterium]
MEIKLEEVVSIKPISEEQKKEFLLLFSKKRKMKKKNSKKIKIYYENKGKLINIYA